MAEDRLDETIHQRQLRRIKEIEQRLREIDERWRARRGFRAFQSGVGHVEIRVLEGPIDDVIEKFEQMQFARRALPRCQCSACAKEQ